MRKAPISTKSFFTRLALAVFLCAACIVSLIFFSIERTSNVLLEKEVSNLFTAIETGPAQFANLNSKDFSDTQLKRLMDQVIAENPYYLKAEVRSGEAFSQIYATWNGVQRATSGACLKSVEKRMTFSNAIFPFNAILTMDTCQASSRFRHVSSLLAIGVGAGFILLFAVVFALMTPLFASIRAASRLIASSPDSDHSAVSELRFLPIRNLAEQAMRVRELERDAALARMMQMMAHDIRKPFTMLRMAFDVVSNAKTDEQSRNLSRLMMPEVLQAMGNANGLIQDVMEFSSRANLQTEPTPLRKLLSEVLHDCFSTQPRANVELDFAFVHSRQALIDAKKVARVLSNILTNAIEAIHGHGKLHISTADGPGGGWLQISLTNTGSFIEESDREHLFDSFFTKGKKEGTGLGLAICKKIVTAHGGEIWVESGRNAAYTEGFVTFHFTLPTAIELENAWELPRHSSAYGVRTNGFQADGTQSVDSPQKDDIRTIDAGVLKSLLDSLESMASLTLRISIVDDETAYREGLMALVRALPDVSDKVEVVSHESCPAGSCRSDLVLMDVDMGAAENGFEATRRLRNQGSEAFICIHSNRILAEDLKHAVDAGADAFVPKPMTLEQLAKILAQAAERVAGRQPDRVNATLNDKPELVVAFVEDSIALRLLWKHAWKWGRLETFGRPEECIEAIRNGALKPDLVVTDFNFERESPMTGFDLARTLQGMTDARVVLASDGLFELDDFAGAFREIIAKAIPTREQLQSLLPTEKVSLLPATG